MKELFYGEFPQYYLQFTVESIVNCKQTLRQRVILGFSIVCFLKNINVHSTYISCDEKSFGVNFRIDKFEI